MFSSWEAHPNKASLNKQCQQNALNLALNQGKMVIHNPNNGVSKGITFDKIIPTKIGPLEKKVPLD